jgi:hypothetical protein
MPPGRGCGSRRTLDAYVRRIMVNSNRSRFRGRRVPEYLTGSPPDLAVGGQVDVDDDVAELRAALLSLVRVWQ